DRPPGPPPAVLRRKGAGIQPPPGRSLRPRRGTHRQGLPGDEVRANMSYCRGENTLNDLRDFAELEARTAAAVAAGVPGAILPGAPCPPGPPPAAAVLRREGAPLGSGDWRT